MQQRSLAAYQIYISIHAPSRERPKYVNRSYKLKTISIHAPSRERRRIAAIQKGKQYFNPRSLTGATLSGGMQGGYSTSISIHAPSRERHVLATKVPGVVSISIHAPSRERPGVSASTRFSQKFQSTLPHGSDWLYLRRL